MEYKNIYPKKEPSLLLVEEDEELLVHNPKTKNYHMLNKTATLIFKFCDEVHSINQIIGEILKIYRPTSPQHVRDKIIETIKNFHDLKLVELEKREDESFK